jgi:hypothetical protein
MMQLKFVFWNSVSISQYIMKSTSKDLHSVTDSHSDLFSWKFRNEKSYESRSRIPVMSHVCKRDSRNRAMVINKKLKLPVTGHEGP